MTAINRAFGWSLAGVLSLGLLSSIGMAQNPVGAFDAQTDVGQRRGSRHYGKTTNIVELRPHEHAERDRSEHRGDGEYPVDEPRL